MSKGATVLEVFLLSCKVFDLKQQNKLQNHLIDMKSYFHLKGLNIVFDLIKIMDLGMF